MKVFALGASKNIGYHSAVRLLYAGDTIVFMLRNTSVFDNDPVMQPFVASGQAKLVKGDALKEDDVRNAWAAALEGGPVDLALFSVGAPPGKFVLGKGFCISPANICTRSMLNFLKTMPLNLPQLKIVVVTSAGTGRAGHSSLPFFLRLVYGFLIAQPHADKLGMDRVIFHALGKSWPPNEYPIKPEVLPSGWEKELPAPGFLKNVLVVKPVMLVGGVCKADEAEKTGGKGYRVSTGDGVPGSYTVSREDVAHFIVKDGLKNWNSWNGKAVSIGY